MRKKLGLKIGLALLVVVGFSLVIGLNTRKKIVKLELIGDDVVNLEVFTAYEDLGVDLYINGELSDEAVTIDTSFINHEILGEYEVHYSYDDKNTLVRRVVVVDTTAPVITLKGTDEVPVLGDVFKEPGFLAEDNYDKDITEHVVVEGNVDSSKVGVYTLTYSVKDTSGNGVSVKRTVTVKEKPKVIAKPGSGKPNIPSKGFGNGTCKVGDGSMLASSDPDNLSNPKHADNAKNEVYCLTFVGQGIAIEGTLDGGVSNIGLMNSSGAIIASYDQTQKNEAYTSNLDLRNVANGTYTLVATNKNNEKLISNLNVDRRIVQAKVGSKLVKVSYPGNTIQVTISNHSYKYDIAINVGHGGADGGASQNGQVEKNLNLMISQYEKKEFERHGLRVYMSRNNNNTMGEMAGPSSWPSMRRTAYRMGEIASVSKFTYSNHHNSTTNSTTSGWEILVNARASAKDLAVERSLGKAWDSIYGRTMKGSPIYTKHYYKERVYSKTSGQVYDFIDWYGMQRIPDMLFNEFVPTYEHIYISNPKDVVWYNNGAWKQMADAKVKEYVTALGITYIKP